MRTSSILSTAVLVTGAMANLPDNVAVVATPTANADTRQLQDGRIDLRCIDSVSAQVAPPTGRSSGIQSWVAGPFLSQDSCTYTMSATLSSGLTTYLSDVVAWASTVESKASEITTACGAAFTISFAHVCPTSITALLTDSDETRTASFPPVGAPTKALYFGNNVGLPPNQPHNTDSAPHGGGTHTSTNEDSAAASIGRPGMTASAVAAAAVVGVVFAL